MQDNRTVKAAMAAYLERHHVPAPRYLHNQAWGNGAKLLAWRTSTHAGMHPSTEKTQALCNLLFPPNAHTLFRSRLVHAYDALMGTKEGSATQRAIAKFCGLSAREPWCAETFWYASKAKAGYDGPHPDNIAYVPSWELFARKMGLIVPESLAAPGMGVTFVWDYAKYVGSGDHIGIIRETGPKGHVIDYSPITEEGNTGGSGGDAVRRETRSWAQVNVVFDLARLQKH